MKSILAALLVSVLSVPRTGHAFGPDEFARLARDRMAAIRATPNRGIPAGAICRYVSATGDDAADGRTPSSAWRTLERLSQEKLPPGAFALLERGGLYRGTIRACAGVTYTAYGEGPKPVICGSPEDGANPSKWRQTENPKVWAYEIGHRDVGTLVFDGGATHAVKVLIRTVAKTGRKTDLRTGRPFTSYRDLCRDLDFWHDYSEGGTGLLYLCSETNPGVRFKSIEFNVKRNGVSVRGNADVTVDNLCIRCVGGHGVGAGTCRNLTVSNCEFAWIGGSIQGEGLFGRDHPTRFGNGVEIYGGCDGYVVSNCIIRQVYDAAVTHQFNICASDGMKRFDQRHVRYIGNVIGRCNYSVEYFLTAPNGNPSLMEDVVAEDNLMFDAGVGFCEQRPDRGFAAHVKGDWRKDRNRAHAFVFRNNVMCRSQDAILRVGSALRNADGSSSLPRFERNVLLSAPGAFFGYVSEEPSALLPFGPEAQSLMDRLGSGNRCVLIGDEPVVRKGK